VSAFLFLNLVTYYVYILYSKRKNLFYKGHTAKLEERLVRHNFGYEKATKSKGPWTLIWSTPKPTRNQAYQLEYKLKNLSRKRLIRFILKHHKGIAGPDEMSLMIQPKLGSFIKILETYNLAGIYESCRILKTNGTPHLFLLK
jgi:Predicted endonuclease containing a URI domain